jgi:beta-fructofuranosidase
MARWIPILVIAVFLSVYGGEALAQAAQPGETLATIHYRPVDGWLADTIPFYWKGEYHIFYLLAGLGGTPWAHISSSDLVHWKEYPVALPLGSENDPDGENVFTGSVIERNGTFHIFYTGWNPGHPGGREQIMHATSPDLVTWTKHPEKTFRADNVHYRFKDGEDFRDPFVFWNADEKQYWMLLCARDARTNAPVTGVAVSKDLEAWEQMPPLVTNYPGTPECPDLFKMGDKWYLITSPSVGLTIHRTAKDLRGVWSESEMSPLDTPILYAAKSMSDGKRQILTGWLRDLEENKDDGGFRWGGHQSVPREIFPGSDGQLRSRPVPEALALYTRKTHDLTDKDLAALVSDKERLDVPNDYLLQTTLQMEPGAEASITFRGQTKPEEGYHLVIRPSLNEIQISSPQFCYPRRCLINPSKPVTVKAFVEGNLIECFVNDEYAFSARAYNFPKGDLRIEALAGKVKAAALSIFEKP